MNKGCSRELLRICTSMSLIMGSILYASEPKKPLMPQRQPSQEKTKEKKAPEKKEQKEVKPFDNFNSFARTIYKSDKTEENAATFAQQFKQQDKQLSRQKRCKQEIQLALDDFK